MGMETAKPQAEHGFLEKLVGTWEVTSKEMGEGEPWTEVVRSLHGLWVIAEGNGQMPGGGDASTVMTLGYDPDRSRYVGTRSEERRVGKQVVSTCRSRW